MVLDFMKKLDTNLTNSINAFQNYDKSNITDLDTLRAVIQKNSQNMYKYLAALKELEITYFLKIDDQTFEPNKFLHSFNMDSDLYNTNFKESFKDTMQIEINTHKLKLKSKTPPIEEHNTKSINILGGHDIRPNQYDLPVIKDLKAIPPMFYWYDGDTFYKRGVYVCLSKGFYASVPFPNMVSTTDLNFKVNSIPCKHETKEACTRHKKKISEIFNSDERSCSYVHKKEQFVKIGSPYRCRLETFGSYASLNSDMNFINTPDIKRILMHSLSDALLSSLWYQNKFKDGNLFLNNLEFY